MATILDKVKTLLSASFHDMIGKALKRNPIQTLNQYLREHEESLEAMHSDQAVALGNVKSATHKVIDRIEAEIEAILTDDDAANDYLAENLAQDLVGQEEKHNYVCPCLLATLLKRLIWPIVSNRTENATKSDFKI